MNIKHVLEGWRNKLVPPSHLKELIEKTSEARLNICFDCKHHSRFHHTPLRPDAHCVECGCTLSAKTRCLSCSCPFEKWKAVATEEEGEQIEKIVNGKEKRD